MNFTDCPECNLPAEVVDRYVLDSTSGPVEHVRIRCLWGHTFNGAVAALWRERGAA